MALTPERRNRGLSNSLSSKANHLCDSHVLRECQERIQILTFIKRLPIDLDLEAWLRDPIAKQHQSLRLIILP